MKIFKKKETVIPVDENGNPIEKKTIDWKDIGKKALFGLGCAGAGILAFLLVGAAMVDSDDAACDEAIDGTESAAETDSASGSDEG